MSCQSLTRKDVQAEVWLETGLPEAICIAHPEVRDFGIYRKLDDGKVEFLPYCAPEIKTYVVFKAEKFQAFLDALLPEEPK